MTKAKYMYELIDQCMVIYCQNNILVENFELSDEENFYKIMEEDFLMCMKFYDEMHKLFDRNEIDEAMLDHELRTVLALIRQKALRGLLKYFEVFIEQMNISVEEKEKEFAILRQEIQTKTTSTEYLLNKIRMLRVLEQYQR